ncbi:MAG TPA: cysteine synthase family protein [Kofleriaceae bacterium]|nr:cysteine synthase family protein [Kofleriaceae bacterium]
MSLHVNKRARSVLDLIGNTPLIRLRAAEKRAGDGRQIWAKCEFENPGGSVKDRAARQMVLDALADGRLGTGKILIDSTSGNTGVAYSMIGAALGIPVTLVMPANVSVARKNITRAYGTELIFSSEMEGSDGAIRKVRQLVADDPQRYFFPDQYSNPSNPLAHYQGTGAEIIEALRGEVTHFAAGIGTTGTVIGTGRRLKDFDARIQVIAIEPDDALHGLEGLKHLDSSIVPAIWQPDGIIDRRMPMPTDEAWDASELLVREEGIFIGHSAGANVAGAIQVAREAGPGAVVVTVLPDRGDRYFQPLVWERQYTW